MNASVWEEGVVNWQIPPSQLTLEQDSVHLWYTSLQLEGYNLSNYFELLSPNEKARASRYKFDWHRERFIARRAILRIILKKYFNVPNGFEVRSDNLGKLEIISRTRVSEFSVSLSHSQDSVIYAFSNNSKTGIDIEHIKKVDFKSILRTILPAYKLEIIDSLQEFEDIVFFYRIWTTVEAYLKAIGVGFSYPLDKIFWAKFPFDLFEKKITNHQWSIVQFYPDKNIFSTLVLKSSKMKPSFFMFNG